MLVHVWASSAPAAPPNEMMVCAPSFCALVISALVGELLIGCESPQIGVQPEPMMNAAV